MKKILYIGAISDNIGGIEIYIMNIYRKLDKREFKVNFLVDEDIRPVFYNEIKNDIITINSRKKNYINYLKKMKKILIENDYDIIHINLMSLSNFEPIVLAQKYSKANIIIHSHISNLEMSVKTKIINYIGLKAVKKYENKRYVKVACSKIAGDWMFSKFSDKSFITLNNGIDILKYKYNVEERKLIRNQLKLNDDDILLGNIGRLCHQKNQKFLLELLQNLDQKYKLLIIGKGELKEKLINFANKNKIVNRVIFKEDIYNIESYLSAMDIFVFPSIYEGLGIAVIEAEANGLNVFASDFVPKDVVVTPNIKLLDLNIDDWRNELESCNYKDRNNDLKELNNNFNSNLTTQKVINLYKKIDKGE